MRDLVERALAARRPDRAAVVGISGIDASGKGFIAAAVARELERAGARVARIGVDGWLRLPEERFDAARPAEVFYQRALRLDEMFETLVLPLRERRSVRVAMDHTEETATRYRRQVVAFERVDVIVVEGIFLLKRAYQRLYDVSAWIDCSFETALERAVARGQEGLGAEATRRAYATIYFPAQGLHFERDAPRGAATVVVENDWRLLSGDRGGWRPAGDPR